MRRDTSLGIFTYPLRGPIVEVKQRWSVIGWVTKCIISSSSVLRKARQAVPVEFAKVNTHQPALGPRGGLWPVLLMVIHNTCAPEVGTLIG
jgi:hypothetical protein